MQGPHEYADELASAGMIGPDIASTMLREEYDAECVVEALRALDYEVRTKYGNDVHLRGISDYPRGHALYKPLQIGTTGPLPALNERQPTDGNVESLEELLVSAEGNNPADPDRSPYHARSEADDPLPVLASAYCPSRSS